MRIGIRTVYQLAISTSIITVLFISGILHPSAATAATYYVATNGNNANPGTETKPFQTISKGLSVLRASDTLYLRGGTYQESINSQNQTVASGTSWFNSVTIAGYPGETAILRPGSGGNVLNIYGYGTSLKYVLFDRLILDGTNVSDAVFIGFADHIIIQNSEVRNATHQGILTYSPGAAEIKFINLTVHHNGSSRLDHGFYIETPNTLIEGCDIYANSGYGIQVYNSYYGPNDRTDRTVVRNNRVHDNLGDGGVTLSHGDELLFYNNIVYNNLNGVEVSYKIANTGIYNNTIYNHPQGSGIGIGSGSSGAVIKNNIVYQNSIAINDQGAGTLQSQNMTTNPLFVNAGANDFHLQATSSAINTGVAISAVTGDINGTARPQGTKFDIGAYEYRASQVPAPTPRNFKIIAVAP